MVRVEINAEDKLGYFKTSDKVLLETCKSILDGTKVRNKDEVRFPIRAIVNIKNVVEPENVVWGVGAFEMHDMITRFRDNRIAMIKRFRAQYTVGPEFDYIVRGKYPPLEHQKVMFNIARKSDCGGLLGDPGTCKTGPYLWSIDDRLNKGLIKKALVITLASLKKNVVEEAEKQIPGARVIAVKSTKDWEKVMDEGLKDRDVVVTNYESCRLFKVRDFNSIFQMVVLDEAHRMGSPTSKQTQAIMDLFSGIKYRYIATGTLHANNTLSFYMPIRFLGPDIVPQSSYYGFREWNQRAVDPDGRIWRDRSGTKELVQDIMAGIAVRFKKEECLDLPELIQEVIYVELEAEQKRVYTEYLFDRVSFLKDMCANCSRFKELGKVCDGVCDAEIAVSHVLSMNTKLRQMASGFYINTIKSIDSNGREKNESTVIDLGARAKFRAMHEWIDSIPKEEKIIIWSDFTWVVEQVEKELLARKDGGVITVKGSVSAYDSEVNFRDPKYRYFNSMSIKGGTGLNIQYSSYSIYITDDYSFVKKDQTLSRQYRQGQKNNVTSVSIVCRQTIDEKIQEILKNKEALDEELNSGAMPQSLKNPKAFLDAMVEVLRTDK